MRFVETAVFTRALLHLLSDDEYRSLQLALNYPAASCGVSDRSKQDLSVIVGWVEARSVDTHRWGMMGIADAQPILRWNRNAASCGESNPEQLKTLSKLVKENLK